MINTQSSTPDELNKHFSQYAADDKDDVAAAGYILHLVITETD